MKTGGTQRIQGVVWGRGLWEWPKRKKEDSVREKEIVLSLGFLLTFHCFQIPSRPLLSVDTTLYLTLCFPKSDFYSYSLLHSFLEIYNILKI